jgi:hypothetical protein
LSGVLDVGIWSEKLFDSEVTDIHSAVLFPMYLDRVQRST